MHKNHKKYTKFSLFSQFFDNFFAFFHFAKISFIHPPPRKITQFFTTFSKKTFRFSLPQSLIQPPHSPIFNQSQQKPTNHLQPKPNTHPPAFNKPPTITQYPRNLNPQFAPNLIPNPTKSQQNTQTKKRKAKTIFLPQKQTHKND